MNQKTALIRALLDGEILSIKNAYFDLGISNISRECGRSIERPFGVILRRVNKVGKDKYGGRVTWIEYSLNKSLYLNKPGVKRMIEYLNKHK